MPNKLDGHADDNLVFACTTCGKTCNQRTATSGCSCGCNLFKVSGMSTTFNPLMNDPYSQKDPYRKKRNDPDVGQQFTDVGGEGTGTESGMGSYAGPRGPKLQQEEGGLIDPVSPTDSFPSDGGAGDRFPSDANGDALLPENSPLKKKPTRVSPYNNMQRPKNDDPYEIVRKRRMKR